MQIHNPAEKFNISLYRLHNIAQEWKRLLFSTGGALNLQKSFWFAFSWEWREGVAHLSTNKQQPGSLHMTNGSDPTAIEFQGWNQLRLTRRSVYIYHHLEKLQHSSNY
jgi:hypothetical protein